MDTWPTEMREDMVKRLQEKGVNRPCQRCGSEQFTLVEGISVFGLVMRLDAEHVDKLLPSLCVACSRCGNLTFHALNSLGLLQENPPQPPNEGPSIVD